MLAQRVSAFFELQDAASARWLPMEGLRGFAVALVFLVHFADFVKPYSDAGWLNALHEIGNVGVDLFFVLSGFLIYKSCIRRPINVRLYAWRRIERIYPAFLAAFAIYLALMILIPSQSKLPDEAGETVTYILSNLLFLPGMLSIEPIMTVAWSLSYEVFFYLPVPLAIIGLRMRLWRPDQRLVFFLALYAAMIAVEISGFGGRFRLSMFLGGMMLYEILALRPAERRRASALSDLLALGAVGAAFALYALLASDPVVVDSPLSGALPPVTRIVLINVAFVILVYRSVFTEGPAAAAFSWTPLRWLGNISYSFYLMHGLGLHGMFMILGKLWRPDEMGVAAFALLLPVAFAASLAASLPIYLLIERPLSLGAGFKPKSATAGQAPPSGIVGRISR
ncbi:MAG: acyltransferase family protein [Alphaproteobacteria bacterium]